jgi:hypothetical protein
MCWSVVGAVLRSGCGECLEDQGRCKVVKQAADLRGPRNADFAVALDFVPTEELIRRQQEHPILSADDVAPSDPFGSDDEHAEFSLFPTRSWRAGIPEVVVLETDAVSALLPRVGDEPRFMSSWRTRPWKSWKPAAGGDASPQKVRKRSANSQPEPPATNGKSARQQTNRQDRRRSEKGRRRAHNPWVVGSSPTRPTGVSAAQRLAGLIGIGSTAGLVLQPHFESAFVGGVVAASGAGLVSAPPV